MRNNVYKDHFDNEVLEANPMQLVLLLYRGALDSIASARRHLMEGDIRSRSQAINKAMEIVTELSGALDHKRGGELSQALAELYGYVQKLLIQANIEQSPPPLVEAESLLNKLFEGWSDCPPQQPARVNYPADAPADPENYRPVSCAC
jgi:flagellar protein FliS